MLTIMNVLRLIPVILSFLLLGAHFYRSGQVMLAAICVALLFLLFIRKSWVPRLFQILLVLGARRTPARSTLPLRIGVATLGLVLAGGCLSLTLEAIQLLIPERAAGPVDVAANTLGTAIGVLAFSAFTRVSHRAASRER